MSEVKNKTKINIMIGVIALVVVIVVGIFLYFQKSNGKAEVGVANKKITEKQIEQRKKDKAEKGILAASINTSTQFKDKDSEGNFNIENLPENNYDIKVEIYTRDKNPVLVYSSEKIEPGYIIRKDKLSEILDKGTHACNATFIAYDEDGNEVMRNNIQMDITIKN